MPVVHTVSNVICSLIFGHRFSRDDENFHHLIESIDTITTFGNSIYFFERKMILFVCLHYIDRQ